MAADFGQLSDQALCPSAQDSGPVRGWGIQRLAGNEKRPRQLAPGVSLISIFSPVPDRNRS